jgi:hypothetical protein
VNRSPGPDEEDDRDDRQRRLDLHAARGRADEHADRERDDAEPQDQLFRGPPRRRQGRLGLREQAANQAGQDQCAQRLADRDDRRHVGQRREGLEHAHRQRDDRQHEKPRELTVRTTDGRSQAHDGDEHQHAAGGIRNDVDAGDAHVDDDDDRRDQQQGRHAPKRARDVSSGMVRRIIVAAGSSVLNVT